MGMILENFKNDLIEDIKWCSDKKEIYETLKNTLNVLIDNDVSHWSIMIFASMLEKSLYEEKNKESNLKIIMNLNAAIDRLETYLKVFNAKLILN